MAEEVRNQKNVKRTNLLVQVARLYYEHNLSQDEIAKRVNLSRPYVSKLLNEARETGIVRIEINDPIMTETVQERKIREYYNMKRVVIAPTVDHANPLQHVGETAALYLNGILADGDVIGFSWGETVYACVKELPEREDLKDITAVQMCGGVSNIEQNVYVSEVVKVFSNRLNSEGYILPFPAIVDNKQVKKVIDKERTMKEVLRNARKVNIALVTAGRLNYSCAMARAGYLKPEEIDHLKEKGAVGDICTHVINKDGEICDPELDARTVAVPLEQIMKAKTRIGVAIGESKVDCILAALKGGIINVLITDESTVDLIRKAKPEIFE